MTTPRRGARLLPPIVALALGTILPSSVAAHAELVRAIPADGETVTEPVTVLSARYSEALVGDSSLRVVAEDGAVVATGAPDPNDRTRMIARPAQPLRTGGFTVQSTAFSADGHIERTEWTFQVEVPPSPTASPSALPTPTAGSQSPSPQPTPSPTVSPSPTASPEPGSEGPAAATFCCRSSRRSRSSRSGPVSS